MRPAPTAVALLVFAFAAAGCGSSGSAEPAATSSPTTPAASSPAETPSPSESESETPAGTTVEVTVVGKKVTPAPGTVTVAAGEEVTLVLTTDRSGELHVHAADPELETEIEPGTKSFTFATPSQAGVYEVELHDPDLLLFQVKVQ